jgi:hypothetical protein
MSQRVQIDEERIVRALCCVGHLCTCETIVSAVSVFCDVLFSKLPLPLPPNLRPPLHSVAFRVSRVMLLRISVPNFTCWCKLVYKVVCSLVTYHDSLVAPAWHRTASVYRQLQAQTGTSRSLWLIESCFGMISWAYVKIWGFHGGNYEECRLLGCYAVCLLSELKFRRNLAPPSSGSPDDGGAKFLRNVGY